MDDAAIAVREAVAKAVASQLPHGKPALSATATALDLNVRTLQRRLARAGTSFKQIVDAILWAEAMRLMGSDEMSIGQVAAVLGYSDPAHFTRAFQRWTGKSPIAARRAVHRVRARLQAIGKLDGDTPERWS
jgi:AraC-like DNA-binding protein